MNRYLEKIEKNQTYDMISTKEISASSFWRRCNSFGRERAFSSGGHGFDPGYGRPLPTDWVGINAMWPAQTEDMVSPLCFDMTVGKEVKGHCSDASSLEHCC